MEEKNGTLFFCTSVLPRIRTLFFPVTAVQNGSRPKEVLSSMNSIRLHLKFDPSVVMYLVIVDKLLQRQSDLLKVKPSEKFFDMVREQVISHLIDGKEPPEQIAGPILNIADDMLAGREVVMRSGDYITLMNYAKSKKML